MRHSCFHRPYQVTSAPTTFSPPRAVPDIFNIRLRYREGGDWQCFSLVHIPPSVQNAFEQGIVYGLHLEALETNGAASRSLQGQPRYVILGVELADGSKVTSIPSAFHAVFRRKIAITGAVLLTGGILAVTLFPWVGGLLTGLGTHFARTAMGLPRKPFWPPPRQD